MNEFISKIELISKLLKEARIINRNSLILMPQNIEDAKDKLETNNILFETYDNNNILIDLLNLSNTVKFFDSEVSFREQAALNNSVLYSYDIVIFNYKNGYLYYNNESKTFLVNGKNTEVFLIENTISYLNFIKFIISSEFSDYYNTENKEIVLYSTIKGIYKLKIPETPIHFEKEESKKINKCIELLKENGFKIHFINQLFNLPNDQDKQIENLILNLDSIISSTQNDYQLQIKNFSFDKFKTDLQKEKEKYFLTLREMLGKILTQIVGVPVSIGASVFASYKVENNFILILISIAFLIYILFAVYFQYIFRQDILEIEKDFEKDFEKIKTQSGIDVNDDKTKIIRRITNIKTTICIFVFSIIVLATLFIGFITYQIKYKQGENKSNKNEITIKLVY